MGKNCALGLEYGPRPYTDRPSPVNNIFIFFPTVHWLLLSTNGFVHATLVIESACTPSTSDL